MQSWLRSTSNCVCVYWLVRTAATGAAGSTCCGRRTIERRIKAARLPATKSLDGFDFAAIPSLNKMQVLELARMDRPLRERHRPWSKRHRQDPRGPQSRPGRLSKGGGSPIHHRRRHRHELMEARDECQLVRLQTQLVKPILLIIDELGFAPLSKTGAELLFELIPQRYQRGWYCQVVGGRL